MKVSWQVTGVRHDPYAEAYRSPVEVEKPTAEQGTYLPNSTAPPRRSTPAAMDPTNDSPTTRPSIR